MESQYVQNSQPIIECIGERKAPVHFIIQEILYSYNNPVYSEFFLSKSPNQHRNIANEKGL